MNNAQINHHPDHHTRPPRATDGPPRSASRSPNTMVAPIVEPFDSLEELQARFLQIAGVPDLPRYAGPKSFFSSLWAFAVGPPVPSSVTAIPLHPESALLYSCAIDELAGAARASHQSLTERDIEAHAVDFGLSAQILRSPLYSLSGGEKALLLLARTCLVPATDQLVIVSPYRWLSPSNYDKVARLLDHYRGQAVTILLLHGERRPGAPQAPASSPPNITKPFEFTLALRDISIQLCAEVYPHRPRKLLLSFHTPGCAPLRLQSPCLLCGPNGSGKTTLGLILAGAIRSTAGTYAFAPAPLSARARMLMQEPEVQLLGKSPQDYLAWSLRESEDARVQSHPLYMSILERITRELRHRGATAPLASPTEPSILQAKLALITARLLSNPPLLILDEPGLGLSVSVAQAMLAAVANAAADRGLGVLVITHEAHALRPIAGSVVALQVEQERDGWNAMRTLRLGVVG